MNETRAKAWFGLFETAPPPVLIDALRAGLLDDTPTVVDGRDLLFAWLSSSESARKFTEEGVWWGGEPVVSNGHVRHRVAIPRLQDPGVVAPASDEEDVRRRLRSVTGVVEALLERDEVDPLSRHDTPHPLNPEATWSASSLEWALALNLTPVVEKMAHWAQRHGRQDEFRNQLLALDDEGLSPFHRALSANRRALAHFLVEQGASPAPTEKEARPPLFCASGVDMLELLLSAGVDTDATWRGMTIIDHWARLQKGSSLGAVWGGMISRLQGQDPQKKLEADRARGWAWFDKAAVGLEYPGLAPFHELPSTWKQEWAEMMGPALSGQSPHELRRKVYSGPLRGEATILAEMGSRWMKEGQVSSVWFALIKSPLELFGPSPHEIRKGLTDWGVFALGAARHRSFSRQFQKKEGPGPRRELASSSANMVRKAMELVAPIYTWEEHMVAAATVLQRPKNATLWREVSLAFCAYLEELQCQPTKPGASAMDGVEERIALLERALSKGFRWVSPFSSGAFQGKNSPIIEEMTKQASVLLPSLKAKNPRAPELADRWMALAMAMLGHTLEFSEFAPADFSHLDYKRNLRGEMKPFVVKHMEEMARHGAQAVFGTRGVDGNLLNKMDRLLPTLVEWSPMVFTPLQAARLSEALPAAASKASPKPRL